MKGEPRFVLTLFVAGASDRSRQALLQVHHLCATRLEGRHVLEVIDVHQHPELAKRSRIPATPALVRERPRPVKRFFGDLGDEEAVCAGLGLAAPKARKRARPDRRQDAET